MRLIRIEEFRRRFFDPSCKPAEITLRRLLRGRKLPGKKVGGTWYIDVERWRADADPLVEGALRR